jgi:four helix bundle protein
MNNKEFAKQLEKRTMGFAIEIIRLSISLPNSTESKVIRNQITKSGTSIGANYREANRSRSPKDFRIKSKSANPKLVKHYIGLRLLKK